MQQVSTNKCFGGTQSRYEHHSEVLDCDMHFAIFLPSSVAEGSGNTVPVLYWLSGLTCSDENFVTKAAAQAHAEAHGIAIVCPDTSPRGDDVPDDPEGAYDFGLGAGFYVNATEEPWSKHYRMYDYVVDELPSLIAREFPVDDSRVAISGHSMGGHGALVIALRNPERFTSVSAFAPIASPMNCPWGHKALGGYLGQDTEAWKAYDTCELLLQNNRQSNRQSNRDERIPVLVDQGDADNFLSEQLKPDLLIEASREAGYPVELRIQHGYDHSYFFIQTFIGDHVAFHARHLSG